MSMIKYVSPGGWDFDRPVVVPIKYGSRGLVGADRQDFIKVARASHTFLDVLDRIKIASDEVPVHIIALGASEAYGANRNGDAFPAAVCRACYPTFTKFARHYRNHKNKPERGHPHFGIIKAAAWNETMQRVELLTVLNAEKSACDRNGGFVADVELEKLAKDGDYPVSMAARVPFDTCSFCRHKANRRENYCTTNMCKAGGCREHLTRLVKVGGDLHHLHVVNPPGTTWFDISRVFRPADRIAWGARADYLEKAASDHGLFDLQDMLKLATEDTAPLQVILYQDGMPGLWGERLASQIKLGYAMAACEMQERRRPPEAFSGIDNRGFPVEVLGSPGTEKAAAALGALADQKIILHLHDFGKWLNKEELAKAASDHLPGVFQRMIDDNSLERRVEQNGFVLTEKVAQAEVRMALAAGRQSYTLSPGAVQLRAMKDGFAGRAHNPKTTFEKLASDNPDAEQLARDYAVYKLAALERIAHTDTSFAKTARLASRHNYC